MLERRKRRRFPIQQPVVLRIQEDETRWAEVRGISADASETGVLLLADTEVRLETEVEVSICLPKGIQLSALGRVVRTSADSDDKKFAIAVQCIESFAEI
jgi:hypothetical protein